MESNRGAIPLRTERRVKDIMYIKKDYKITTYQTEKNNNVNE